MNTPFDPELLLQLLNIFSQNTALSQRKLAEKMSVSVGSANGYVQYCMRSGFLKKSLLGRTGYQLTDKGLAKRQQLLLLGYQNKFSLGEIYVEDCRQMLSQLKANGIKHVFIQGTSFLSDLSYIACQKEGVGVVAFIDPVSNKRTYLTCPVVPDAFTITPQQSVLFTDIVDTQTTFQQLSAQVGRRRLVVAPMVQELFDIKGFMV